MMPGLEQRDLWGLLPGAAGGRALRDRRGAGYFGVLGTIGGRATVARYGVEHMRELARRSVASRRRRRNTLPRTVQYVEIGQVVTERVIPWWPHQPRRRHRKSPILVRIELACIPPVALGEREIGGER
jgi:hypothetical protein